MANGASHWPLPLGDDRGLYQFYRLGVTAAPILTPTGALITINQAPQNQIRIWGNASLPPFVDLNASLLSCAPFVTSAAAPLRPRTPVGAAKGAVLFAFAIALGWAPWVASQ